MNNVIYMFLGFSEYLFSYIWQQQMLCETESLVD